MIGLRQIVIILFSLIISSLSSNASQDYRLEIVIDRIDEIENFSFLPKSLSERMINKFPSRKHSKDRPTYFFNIADSTYGLNDGTFDVHVWKDSTWINLYDGVYSGYNFYSQVLIINNKLYSLGGYGYWTWHSDLIQFDFEEKEWEIVSVNNALTNYCGELRGTKGDTIVSFLGQYADEKTNQRSREYNGYWLTLNNKEWKKIQINLKEEDFQRTKWYKLSFNLPNYWILYNKYKANTGFTIIDKSTSKIYFKEYVPYGITDSPYFYFSDNRLYWQSSNNKLLMKNMDEAIQSAQNIGKVNFIEEKDQTSKFTIIIIVGAFIIFSMISWIFIRRKIGKKTKKEGSHINSNEMERIYNIISKMKSLELSTEQLDTIFEIDNSSYDNRRAQRARIINELNTLSAMKDGKKIISRHRDQTDRRYFKYQVGKNSQ
ncbi:MAG: hypothetical protein K9I68_00240 [Bacteroidales bacterium]|nr:hypothetical protein [Bacteroidales bacterium]MCF8336407.1 hypothetical protein [Bacteroidales bacterium]